MSEQKLEYAKFSDEELVKRARCGDQQAEEALVLRFGWLVRMCARPLFLMGGDSEDLVQEGMVGLITAIREYDSAKKASFRTFAEICIHNRLHSAVKAASRDKHAPLNRSVSFDSVFSVEAEVEENRANDISDPELFFIQQENFQERMGQIYRQLSPLETRILQLYLSGLSYSEIASTCRRSVKSVDNAVQRIRRKASRQSEQGESSNS